MKPGAVQAVKTLDVVFEFMRAIDAEHVEAMCKAVDVDPATLAGAIEENSESD